MNNLCTCPYCFNDSLVNICVAGYAEQMVFYTCCGNCKACGPRRMDKDTAITSWNEVARAYLNAYEEDQAELNAE